MKTILKKSKVYDEALELQKKIISILTNLQAISESISIELRKLEDELRESKDEEVYREIYSIVHCYYKRKTNLLVSSQDRNEMLEKWKKAKSFLEKQKEQEEQNEKPSKPELKIPDWVHGGWDDEYMINTIIGRYSLHAEVAKKRDDIHDYNLSKSMENWLRNVVKPLILGKQKEQKPAEDKYQQELEATDRWQEGYEAGYNAASKPVEWSEEDEKALKIVTDVFKKVGVHLIHYPALLSWLKSLRPQPHWKPSEKHVEAVRYFVNKHQSEAWAATSQWKEFTALRELLDILQKLM